MPRKSNSVPIWRRAIMIGSGMIGFAILATSIDAYLVRWDALELPVGMLFSAGVLCVMFGGVARIFSSKR